MKKFISISITAICLITLVSCKCSEQRAMEKMVTQTVDTHTFTGFEVYSTTRLCDEVSEEIALYQYNLGWDKSFYDAFSEAVNDSSRPEEYKEYNARTVEECKDAIARDQSMLEYLETIDDKYPDLYNEISFTTYMLTYLRPQNNLYELDACFAKFDRSGHMVAFKPNIKGKWEILGNTCSIPGYNK